MLFHALIARGEVARSPVCHVPTNFRWEHVLTLDGDLVEIIEHPKKDPLVAVCPIIPARGNLSIANTVFDNIRYTFGTGNRGTDEQWAAERHEDYLRTLEQVATVAPEAHSILKFLNDPGRPLICPVGSKLTPELLAEFKRHDPKVCQRGEKAPTTTLVKEGRLTHQEVIGAARCLLTNATTNHPAPSRAVIEMSMTTAKPADNVFFRIQGGDPEWWLSPAVRELHLKRAQERTRKGTSNRGTCSLCLEPDVPLARLVGNSKKLGGMLISNNETAWQGYGRKKAFVTPTCETCALMLVAGLDDIAGDPSMYRPLMSRNGLKLHMLWWPEDHGLPGFWDSFYAAIDSRKEPEEREEALARLTDGHFAILESNTNRLALRRYARVRAEVVRTNVRKWVDLCPTSLGGMATALLKRGKRPKNGSVEHDRHREMLFLALIANETPPLVTQRATEKHLRDDPADTAWKINEKRRDFLRFCDRTLPYDQEETEMQEDTIPDYRSLDLLDSSGLTPTQKFALLLGRAFAETEAVQIGKRQGRKIQRPIGTRLEQCARNPELALRLISRHGSLRGRMTRMVSELHDAAINILMQCPSRLTPTEAYQFRRGYHLHKRARFAWKAQEKAEAKAEAKAAK